MESQALSTVQMQSLPMQSSGIWTGQIFLADGAVEHCALVLTLMVVPKYPSAFGAVLPTSSKSPRILHGDWNPNSHSFIGKEIIEEDGKETVFHAY